MNIVKLAELLNNNFGHPFLPEGFVRASIRNEYGEIYLNIRIGDRDIDYSAENNVIGAGTNVGSGKQWDIKRIDNLV